MCYNEIMKRDFNRLKLIVFLFLYYIVWTRYFAGGRDTALLEKKFGPIPMPLTVLHVRCQSFFPRMLYLYPFLGDTEHQIKP